MKRFTDVFKILVITLLIISCTDETRNTSFAAYILPPSDVTAKYTITQDNSGVVTITPSAEGATKFDVYYGDGTSSPAEVAIGGNTTHTYAEGSYEVKVVAYNSNGITTDVELPLVVSFIAPTNEVIDIANDLAVSKQVNITVTADFATMYEFYSGEPGMTDPAATANIGETINYQYTTAGDYDIRIVIKGGAIETTEYTDTFTVTEILQPVASAPTPPARNSSDVISIYGSAYTNISGVNPFPDWGQAGQGSSWAEFDLNGDKMLQYINLSYQGIDFGQNIDASNKEFLHLDVWTSGDVTDLEVSAIRPGPDERPVTVTLTADAWTSIDIPLTDYTSQGLTLGDLFQLKLVGTPWAGGSVFVDNIYFYNATPSGPSGAPNAPANLQGAVTSIFSDSYTNVGVSEWNPNWGQSTTLSELDYNGNKVLKYENLNYTGIVTDYGNPTNLSNRTHVSFDYWTPDATTLAFKIVNTSYPDGDPKKEAEIAVQSVTIGQWTTVSIPLADYTTDMSGITQMLFVSSGATVYIDNLHYYKELDAAPTTTAVDPTQNNADVVSIYSDIYTNVTVNEWNPNWGQSTTLTTETINGNNFLKYSNLNYTGIVTDYGNPTDVSSKTFVHFDYWSNDVTSLAFKTVNTSYPDGDPKKEAEVSVSNLQLGEWISVDIPLSAFSTDASGITQMLFASSGGTVYVDNLFFY